MAVTDLAELLATMRPTLNPGRYAFCIAPSDLEVATMQPLGVFRESEGLTVIVEESVARAHGLTPVFVAAWITLAVHSDLEAVGLTAAVSTALARAGISCNVVAAVHHDHLFVPVAKAAAAIGILQQLA